MLDGMITYNSDIGISKTYSVPAAHLDFVAAKHLPASPHDFRKKLVDHIGKGEADELPPTVMGLMIMLAYYLPSPYWRTSEYELEQARKAPITQAIQREIKG